MACADCVLSATLVAVTVTLVVAVTLGAVNMPLGEIVPFEADQATERFEALLTVAVKVTGTPKTDGLEDEATAVVVDA